MIAKEEFRRPRKNVGSDDGSARDVPGAGVFDMANPTG